MTEARRAASHPAGRRVLRVMAESDEGPPRRALSSPVDSPGDNHHSTVREDADGVDRVEQDWRRERPDIDVSSVGIVTRIWRIARHLEQQRKEQLAGRETDRGTVDVLAMLRRAGTPYRQTAGALTRSALITSGGVSQRLDRLERAGLITRHVDPEDRRRVDVELTRAGMELVDSLLTDLMDHDTQVLAAALDDHEQETLQRLLRKLLLSLEPPGPES